ncbi:uncharacterized protein LOC144094541 [Amblyomma americanum]
MVDDGNPHRALPLRTSATRSGASIYKWRGILLLAWVSTRPNAALAGALDDAIRTNGSSELPFFRLDASQGVLTGNSLSNFTCIAVTGGDVSFAWSLAGKPIDARLIGETLRVPIPAMGVDLHVSFASLSAFLMGQAERASVTCRVQLLHGVPTALLLSAAVRAGPQRLHSGFGDRCRGSAARGCVGEATVCDPRPGHGLCVCDPHRAMYEDELRTCVLRKQLGEPCLFEEHCDARNQRCHRNLCVCQDSYERRGEVCTQNASLNGVCDAFRLCPEGSACTDNLCKCAKGYYDWGGKCQRRLITDSQGRMAIVGMLVLCTFVVVLAMAALAFYFYRHSCRPSLMIERTGSSWDFFPTATTIKRDSL